MTRKANYSISGYPAFILCVIPMVIGWVWIVKTLLGAVV